MVEKTEMGDVAISRVEQKECVCKSAWQTAPVVPGILTEIRLTTAVS